MEYQLIEFVKENPVLYDKKFRSPNYREQKIQKWNQIAKVLRRDPNTVRLKWKSLRDTFKKRLHRKLNEEDDALSTKNWKYHKLLMFLKDQYPDPETAPEPKLEDGEELQQILEEQLQEEFQQELQEEYEEDQNLTNEPDFEVENFNLNEYLKKFDITNNPNSANTDEPTKKRRLDKDSIITEAAQEMQSLLQCAKQHFTPPSATQIFFNSMALQVEEANLPPVDLMRLQQRVLEAVTQEIVMCQDGTTYVLQV